MLYYITTIGDYSIISYCWLFYVIRLLIIGSYSIVGYSKLFFMSYYWLF